MKIIQIRGCHGCGKSTAVKQFIHAHNMKEATIEANKKKIPIQITDDKKIVVIGRYNTQCGGCDLLKGNEEVFASLKTAIETYKPEIVVFEGVMYGAIITFSKTIGKFARSVGYEFQMIYLHDDFDKIIERIRLRNGGKDFKIENTFNKFMGCAKSTSWFIENGYNVKSYKTSEIQFDNMYKVIESEI